MLDCGRRFGKDVIERNYAAEGVIAAEPVGWYEPDYKSLLQNWSWMCNALAPITKRKSEQERTITTVNGGVIEFWSLENKDASRGRHYKRVVINEAAKVPHLEYSWNAVIRPTLLDLEGGAMIGSTPKGMNYFWQLYRRGMDEADPLWSSWSYTTYDNPYIDKNEIDELKRSQPEIIFRQEIMAEFITDMGSVFRRVQEAATAEIVTEAQPGRQYIAGVDVASAVDYTVVTVIDVEAKAAVYLDRFNRVDYNVLVDRLEAIHKRYNLDAMKIESNSIGQPVIDMLYGRGMNIIPFTTTNATKQTVIQNLQAAFEHGNIRVINDPVLIGELLSFESKRNASGSFSYAAPEGMHDDCVMSLAIAWDGLQSQVTLIKNPFY